MSACQVKQQHASRNSDTTGAEHVCWNFILFRTTPADAKNKKRRAGTMATYSEQDMRLYASAVMFNVALYNHAIAESCQRVPNGMAETYTMHDSECFRSRAISVYQYILIALQHDTRPMASLVQMLGCNNLATQHASHKSKFQLVANFMAQSTQPLVNAMVGQETTNGILLNILLSSIHRAASAA
uniref:Uncharacterized protein n=1 Tax=Craspedostauros australis TaxID=1486917 RepID=A0A7R9ZLP7_9STRA